MLTALLAALLAVTPEAFGAKGDCVTDDSAAFNAAIESLKPANKTCTPAFACGGVLELSACCYALSHELVISKQIRVLGVTGGPNFYGATTLQFAKGSSGVTLKAPAVLENIIVKGSYYGGNGITVNSPSFLTNVWVTKFSGNGVEVYGDVAKNGPTSNANNWRITNVRADSNGAAGFYVHGGDSNAGLALGIDATNNAGAGILDDSFLGCTWIQPHLAGNQGGAARLLSRAARSLLLNPYVEGGTTGWVEIVTPNMQIGGNVAAGQVRGTGYVVQSGNFTGGWYFGNTVDPTAPVVFKPGSREVPLVAFELYRPDYTQPLRMTYDSVGKRWVFREANVATLDAFSFSTKDSPVGPGVLQVPSRLVLGNNVAQVSLMQCTARPTRTDLSLGSICFNTGTSTVTGWRWGGKGWRGF